MDRYSYIKSLLVRRKISHQQLADEIGVSRPNVSGVLNGHWKSRKVQEYVAKKLNRDFHKLWGRAA